MSIKSVHDVYNILIERLIVGSYQLGGRLPSARELARELGVHRNTVAKAYQLLADAGMVTSTRGRGTFVTDLTVPQNRQNLHSSVAESIERSILQAHKIGIPKEDLKSMISGITRSVYETPLTKGFFVECNVADVNAHIVDIASATGVRLAPLLLEELPETIQLVSEDATTMVFTTLFHYREVRELLSSLQPRVEVIGVHTIPSERSVEQLALIPAGARVGVVANNPEGAKRIANLVETYSQTTTITLSAPGVDRIRELASEVDVIVSTRDQGQIVQPLELDVPVLIIPFHVSPHSNSRVLDAMLGEGTSR